MLRLLAPFVLLTACDWTEPDTAGPGHHPISDPDAPTCDIGAFEVAAPRDGLHYDRSLDVLVDESELWASLTVVIADDIGDSFLPTMDSTEAYPHDSGTWWNRDTFHFNLAPSTRYTLSVSHCTTKQTVTFFTSP